MPKAVRYNEYGGVDVLNVVEVPMPEPGPGQVLVQVKAAGINPGEAKIREGLLHSRWPATFPSGQGSDLAGIVEQTGPAELRAAFESEHQARYGYHDPEQEIELVTVRVSAFGEAQTVALQPAPGLPEPGATISGPTVLRLPESTVLIPEGWRGRLAGGGALILERSK